MHKIGIVHASCPLRRENPCTKPRACMDSSAQEPSGADRGMRCCHGSNARPSLLTRREGTCGSGELRDHGRAGFRSRLARRLALVPAVGRPAAEEGQNPSVLLSRPGPRSPRTCPPSHPAFAPAENPGAAPGRSPLAASRAGRTEGRVPPPGDFASRAARIGGRVSRAV